jgi:DNA processing protein
MMMPTPSLTNDLPADVRDLLALHLVPGIGPRLTAALLERFGSAAAVLRARPEQLAEVPHIGPQLAARLGDAMAQANVPAELDLMSRHGVRLLALGSPEYPAALATIPDPPHLLYVRGSIESRDANAVAVVGSRQCTSYGRRVAERLAADLARAGWTILSGLARGIDGVAHRGALQAGGRTIAVLAGGLSRIYPPEHSELADQVTTSGALVTEAAMRMEPMAGLFPARNRIISGLARAVVVVEANEKSGALITARLAGEQGRTVLAVPGPVDSDPSAGSNALIRRGAVLCRGADDVLEELNATAPLVPSADGAPAPPRQQEPPPGLDETQRRVWDFLAEQVQHVDDMARQLQIAVPELSRTLMLLEMKRAVRRLPGNRYERT